MRPIGRTFESSISVSTVGGYSFWIWDLSTLTENNLMVEIETTLYDEGFKESSIRYQLLGLANDTTITTDTLTGTQFENYSFSSTNAGISVATYVQGSGRLTQEINNLTSSSRKIKAISHIKVIAF